MDAEKEKEAKEVENVIILFWWSEIVYKVGAVERNKIFQG